jgi:hypothetical protein
MTLKNSRHEKFCQCIASGMSASKAYRKAGYDAGDADACASRLSRNVKVAARIEELRSETEQNCRITRDEVLDFLSEVIITPAGSVHKGHRLCQSFKATPDCTEVKIPDKLGAVAQLCKMLPQWVEPERIESKLEILVRKI